MQQSQVTDKEKKQNNKVIGASQTCSLYNTVLKHK